MDNQNITKLVAAEEYYAQQRAGPKCIQALLKILLPGHLHGRNGLARGGISRS